MFPRGSSRNLMRNVSDRATGQGAAPHSIFAVTKTRSKVLRNKDQTLTRIEEPLQFYRSPIILMDKISKLIYDVIDEKVKSSTNLVKYNPRKMVVLCQLLANDIRRRVKQLEMRKYRIVAMVSILPKCDQGVNYKMGLRGDHLVDFFGNNSYETNTLFILGTVYMVFKD